MADEFVMTRRVEFSETDMAGVLHFASYYRFLEEIEHAFWRSKGASVMTKEGGRTIGWPRVATSCEYFEPLRFEDEVELARLPHVPTAHHEKTLAVAIDVIVRAVPSG